MAGSQIAFRRDATGAPVAEYGRVVDRARVNRGGWGTQNSGSAVASTSISGPTITAHASANTKGSYTEIITSTAFDAELVTVVVSGLSVSSGNTGTLLDIAVGGAGSEVDLIPNLTIGGALIWTYTYYNFPVRISSGTRISARIQSVTGGLTVQVGVYLQQQGYALPSGTTVTAIGALTGTSAGTALTTVGSTHTKGAWAQLTASTAADYRWIVPVLSMASTTVASVFSLTDIGIGGSGSEVVLIPDIPCVTITDESARHGGGMPYLTNTPAGSRLAIRYQADQTSAGGKPQVAVYGIA